MYVSEREGGGGGVEKVIKCGILLSIGVGLQRGMESVEMRKHNLVMSVLGCM